ncbi:M20 aminoacylase family protein [Derxia gummosa]|uniref:M20 aminoacylase family protein n=1 Tax=Derxia gummosa DSM 723 TaxID=1121388 RepID=A0A8B6X172_9BURK|nr:M20 aminoacylase family protein [Derxia gummosa]
MRILPRLVEIAPQISAIRRDIHAHPEVSYEEHRTSELVARLLEGWGIAVTRGLGGTGVVGTLAAGTSQRAIALRADLDALPLQEHNHFAHRSTHDGKMHACGHDGHTAMLLAAAQYLSESRNFDGRVHFIFQPAEEGGAGAKAMIDDGLFERFDCEAVFGMHNWPGIPAGKFALRPGPWMASSNEFTIRVEGKGAHAAMPHLGVDTVMVAVQLAQALQGVIARERNPLEPSVLSITQIHAGDAYNVIPNEAMLRGTVRTFGIPELDRIESAMQRLVDGLPPAFGATASMKFLRNYPATINHPGETAFCASVLTDLVGTDGVILDREPTMGAEDFSYFLLEKPGCYVFIGNGDGDHRDSGHGLGPCTLHNPSYDFNDDLIPLGASYWARLVARRLSASNGT